MKPGRILFVAMRFLAGRSSRGKERDLASKALRGAVVSVAIGLVPLVVVLNVADGMISGITARYVELGTGHAQLRTYGGEREDFPPVRESVRAMPGVSGAWLEIQGPGMAFANGRKDSVALRGIETGFLENEGTKRYLEAVEGSLDLARPYDALLGSALAAKLGVHPGDSVNLITERTLEDGSIVPRVTIFSVRGVVSGGYRELDAHWMFARVEAAGRVLSAESSKAVIVVKFRDSREDAAMRTRELGRSVPSGFVAYSWMDLERNLFASLNTTRALLLLIMALIIVVAVVNISSALSTLASERSGEIAILKACGAPDADIRRIFTLSGVILGSAGAVLGTSAGAVASIYINVAIGAIEKTVNAVSSILSRLADGGPSVPIRLLDPGYYLESIPVTIHPGDLAAIILFTTILSAAMAGFPASRAARMSPLEILRKR